MTRSEGIVKDIPTMETSIRIGKNRLTDALLSQIRDQVKRAGTLKVRVLKSAVDETCDAKHYARELEKALGIKVHDVRGNTIVISKR